VLPLNYPPTVRTAYLARPYRWGKRRCAMRQDVDSVCTTGGPGPEDRVGAWRHRRLGTATQALAMRPRAVPAFRQGSDSGRRAIASLPNQRLTRETHRRSPQSRPSIPGAALIGPGALLA